MRLSTISMAKKGSALRAEFDAKTQTWYLRDERKKRRITATPPDDKMISFQI